ncbi:putative GTP-binding protein EngB [Colletotrichum chlorophyti]|uniref:Putative GTP-binding protein EngB n=1 Tax=Colletotrichum chlorophyti TaxID=708187 RepID=A0A1Q8RLR3_9PEZI|nr:putative GTP-binding protein EngB [Colletotrichum chlorophyti]
MERSPRPRTPTPRTGPRVREAGPSLIPKLPQEELDKIGTPKDVWDARSMYFTAPKRPKEHTQPKQPPRNRNAAPTARSIKAAIQGVPEESLAALAPTTPLTDAGTITASPATDLPHALAAKFFLTPPATFLYSAYTFKHHPLNTTTPEICIVGASNCGKSTFINALTASASLAKVSDRAGKTVSMNAYGVGPLTNLPFRKPVASSASGAPTKESKPEHGIVLVDTPGYGYASHEQWGREIVEYVNKRTMLRGIVLLLSAEKRVSAKDAQIVKLLADAGRPVMVVLTKMDKVLARRGASKDEEGGVAERLREVERCFARTGWDGWVNRIHLTAARMDRDKSWKLDGTRSAAGMAGVRMGILDLAGVREFVVPERVKAKAAEAQGAAVGREGEEDKSLEPGKALESDPAAWSGEVISFEELEKKFGDWSS